MHANGRRNMLSKTEAAIALRALKSPCVLAAGRKGGVSANFFLYFLGMRSSSFVPETTQNKAKLTNNKTGKNKKRELNIFITHFFVYLNKSMPKIWRWR